MSTTFNLLKWDFNRLKIYSLYFFMVYNIYMNQKGFISLIIMVIVAVVAAGGVYFVLKGKQQTAPEDIIITDKKEISIKSDDLPLLKIPKNVIEKYQELEKIYEQSLGTFLSSCTKGDQFVYRVSGSGGFTGIDFYYDDVGNELGSYSWSDIFTPGKALPKPPINILEYDCTVLKKSEKLNPPSAPMPVPKLPEPTAPGGDINIPTDEEGVSKGTVMIRVGEIGSINIKVGDQLTVPVVVDASEIGDLNIASVDITLRWDSSVLRFVSILQGEFGSLTINDSEAGDGVIRVATFSAEGTTQSFTIFEVEFQAENSGMTNLDVTVNVVGDELGTNITSSASSRNLSVVVN